MQPYGNPQQQYQQQQPKKGMSTLAIVLIVLGVLAVLGMGTCGLGALFLAHEAKGGVEQMTEGGALILSSPPEVTAALAGAKKDYVGSWVSAKGSTLDIREDGSLSLVKKEHGQNETMNFPIAAFSGNNIEIKAFVVVTMNVTSPPHTVGDHMEMPLDGITFKRDAAAPTPGEPPVPVPTTTAVPKAK